MFRSALLRVARQACAAGPLAAAAPEACCTSTSVQAAWHPAHSLSNVGLGLRCEAYRLASTSVPFSSLSQLHHSNLSHPLQSFALSSSGGASQLQWRRGLLGVVQRRAPVNYQNHNQKKPKKIKMKTPSVAKRRFIVDKEGTIWRQQANRRHYRSRKSKSALQRLKGLAPLAPAWQRKLRKLGFKRRWWYPRKS